MIFLIYALLWLFGSISIVQNTFCCILCNNDYNNNQLSNVLPKLSQQEFNQQNTTSPFFKTLYNAVVQFELFGQVTERSLAALQKVRFPPKNLIRFVATLPAKSATTRCIFCSVVVKYLFIRGPSMCKQRRNRNLLTNTLIFVCSVVLYSKEVCTGVIESNMNAICFVAKHSSKHMTVKQACAIIMQDYGCYEKHRPRWKIDIPPEGVAPVRVANTEGCEKNIKILHLTDIHVDRYYSEGANAVCGDPVCCAYHQKKPAHAKDMAGKWGDYRNCDMPWYFVEHLLEHLQNQVAGEENVKYIYFTGDIIDHRVWNTSIEDNTATITRFYEDLKVAFKDIQIFPSLGNHESHPVNLFAPSSIGASQLSTDWLYDTCATLWAAWLPKEALSTVRKGGYYTVLVQPGFRIVSLNSNVCFLYNWWLVYDNVDPYNQLQWLVSVLQQAEDDEESVHILSHVPPGDITCLTTWFEQYRRIVNRFSNTITGQFNGHTHFGDFRLFYNQTNATQPINIAFIGGSLTTYGDVNPNYRFYEINPKSFEVLDFHEWTYSVSEANQKHHLFPKWMKLYSFKDAFGLGTASPENVGAFVRKMAHNKTLVDKYFRAAVREGDPHLLKGCNKECAYNIVCSIVNTDQNLTQCNTIAGNI